MSRYRSSTDPKTAMLMFIVMGVALLIASAMALSSVMRFKNTEKACSETVQGTVTNVTEELRTRRRRRHTTTYYVYNTTFLYVVDGEEYYSYSVLSKEQRLSVGATINVHYAPDNPDMNYTAYDDPGTSSAVGVVVTAVLGVLALVGAFSMKRKIALGGTGFGYGGLDGKAMDQLEGKTFNNRSSYNSNSYNSSTFNSNSYSSNNYSSNNYSSNTYNSNGYNTNSRNSSSNSDSNDDFTWLQ